MNSHPTFSGAIRGDYSAPVLAHQAELRGWLLGGSLCQRGPDHFANADSGGTLVLWGD